MFIGTDLYYSQDFVDDRIKEIEKLREHTSNQDGIIAEANNRLYKAIEYIENEIWFNRKDLLKILKGE